MKLIYLISSKKDHEDQSDQFDLRPILYSIPLVMAPGRLKLKPRFGSFSS